MGDKAAKSIGASDIESSRLMAHGQKPKDGGPKDSTVNRYLAVLKGIFFGSSQWQSSQEPGQYGPNAKVEQLSSPLAYR